MLRRQLKDLDLEYERLEGWWQRQPRFELAVMALRWCKRKRDMFDSADGIHSDLTGYVPEHVALEPMVCRVDVMGHVAKWEERIRVWRGRFQSFSSVDACTPTITSVVWSSSLTLSQSSQALDRR